MEGERYSETHRTIPSASRMNWLTSYDLVAFVFIPNSFIRNMQATLYTFLAHELR